MLNIVGLFGTCGGSKWREEVMEQLKAVGIDYFNPVVPEWTPEDAVLESQHLVKDKVLLFAITGETESYGSLAETGWAALSAERHNQTLYVVIEDVPGGPKMLPNRARALVRSHATKLGFEVYESVQEAVKEIIRKW